MVKVMAKKVTMKGAGQAAFDVLCMALYFIGGVAGIMYASVLTEDLSLWFYLGTSVFLLFQAITLLGKVTKPVENYETEVVA